MAQKDTNNTTAKRAALGVGALAAAAAAAAAGYYFYASEDAPKNRRIAAKWARDMKNDIAKQAKKVKDLDRTQMMALIDGAAAAYKTARDIDPKELSRARKELRDNWQDLIAELRGKGGTTTVRAAKTTRAKSSTKSRAKKSRKK